MSSLLTFFLIAFAVTWTCWIAVIKIPLEGILRTVVFITGVFAPAFAAIIVTRANEGAASTRALLARMLQWRVDPRLYLFAVSYMAAVKLLTAVIYRIIEGAWPAFGQVPVPLLFVAICVSTPVQSGEALGWRGYALPRLAQRMGYAWASLVLGLIWACWHLPQFYVTGYDTTGQSFPIWAVQVVAVSVAMAWLFVGARGSLFLTMLMHSAINQTSGIVSGAVPGANDVFALHASRVTYITTTILWIMAAYFLSRMTQTERTNTSAGDNSGIPPGASHVSSAVGQGPIRSARLEP